jgi:phosphoheptose isomerase
MRSNSSRLVHDVRAHLLKSAEIQHQVAAKCVESILAVAALIADTFRSGGKLLLCGNGGSAADCQHMAAEFVNRLSRDFDRPGLPALALTTDTSVLTAFANDFGYEGVFERQVRALGKPGDALMGISTSGNSRNVLRAVKAAREMGMSTIGLLGARGALKDRVDYPIAIPSRDTQHVQEALLGVEHILCRLVEQDLFAAAKQRK